MLHLCSVQRSRIVELLRLDVEPFLIATNPVIFKALRAFARAAHHGPTVFLNAFLALALAFLLTILPALFLIRSDAIKPPVVFALLPRSTIALACEPVAILLTAFFFIAFIAAFFFITFMAFMAAFFFITFMAFMAAFFFITFGASAFMAFIALAIAM